MFYPVRSLTSEHVYRGFDIEQELLKENAIPFLTYCKLYGDVGLCWWVYPTEYKGANLCPHPKRLY